MKKVIQNAYLFVEHDPRVGLARALFCDIDICHHLRALKIKDIECRRTRKFNSSRWVVEKETCRGPTNFCRKNNHGIEENSKLGGEMFWF